jgi:hypothetical protein
MRVYRPDPNDEREAAHWLSVAKRIRRARRRDAAFLFAVAFAYYGVFGVAIDLAIVHDHLTMFGFAFFLAAITTASVLSSSKD